LRDRRAGGDRAARAALGIGQSHFRTREIGPRDLDHRAGGVGVRPRALELRAGAGRGSDHFHIDHGLGLTSPHSGARYDASSRHAHA